MASANVGAVLACKAHTAKKSLKGEDFATNEVDCVWPRGATTGVHFSYFGLFDGHGGQKAAQMCKQRMLSRIIEEMDKRAGEGPTDAASLFERWQSSLGACLVAAFQGLDAIACAADDSGSTATVVLCYAGPKTTEEPAELFACCANVGDSHAFLYTGSAVLRLNADHRLDANKAECARCRAAGGTIDSQETKTEQGCARLWPGGLMMSRTIGDVSAPQAIATPQVRIACLPPSGGRVVLASDGLWDVVSGKQAAKLTHKLLPQAAASLLTSTAQRKESRDDITVTVADVWPPLALPPAATNGKDAKGGAKQQPWSLPNNVPPTNAVLPEVDDVPVHWDLSEDSLQLQLQEGGGGEKKAMVVPAPLATLREKRQAALAQQRNVEAARRAADAERLAAEARVRQERTAVEAAAAAKAAAEAAAKVASSSSEEEDDDDDSEDDSEEDDDEDAFEDATGEEDEAGKESVDQDRRLAELYAAQEAAVAGASSARENQQQQQQSHGKSGKGKGAAVGGGGGGGAAAAAASSNNNEEDDGWVVKPKGASKASTMAATATDAAIESLLEYVVRGGVMSMAYEMRQAEIKAAKKAAQAESKRLKKEKEQARRAAQLKQQEEAKAKAAAAEQANPAAWRSELDALGADELAALKQKQSSHPPPPGMGASMPPGLMGNGSSSSGGSPVGAAVQASNTGGKGVAAPAAAPATAVHKTTNKGKGKGKGKGTAAAAVAAVEESAAPRPPPAALGDPTTMDMVNLEDIEAELNAAIEVATQVQFGSNWDNKANDEENGASSSRSSGTTTTAANGVHHNKSDVGASAAGSEEGGSRNLHVSRFTREFANPEALREAFEGAGAEVTDVTFKSTATGGLLYAFVNTKSAQGAAAAMSALNGAAVLGAKPPAGLRVKSARDGPVATTQKGGANHPAAKTSKKTVTAATGGTGSSSGSSGGGGGGVAAIGNSLTTASLLGGGGGGGSAEGSGAGGDVSSPTRNGKGAGKGAGKGTGANKGKGGGGGKGHKGSGKDRAVAAVQHTNNNASPDSTGTLPPSPTNEGQAKRNNAKRNGKGKGDCGRPTSAAAAPP